MKTNQSENLIYEKYRKNKYDTGLFVPFRKKIQNN